MSAVGRILTSMPSFMRGIRATTESIRCMHARRSRKIEPRQLRDSSTPFPISKDYGLQSLPPISDINVAVFHFIKII